mmetsp:Transcript_104756/g.333276  ORF Transcript_104756/g.333276 Transcript_104756/m.333276 type:complete len:482 (-) Transcript_104756:211-1656(-)
MEGHHVNEEHAGNRGLPARAPLLAHGAAEPVPGFGPDVGGAVHVAQLVQPAQEEGVLLLAGPVEELLGKIGEENVPRGVQDVRLRRPGPEHGLLAAQAPGLAAEVDHQHDPGVKPAMKLRRVPQPWPWRAGQREPGHVGQARDRRPAGAHVGVPHRLPVAVLGRRPAADLAAPEEPADLQLLREAVVCPEVVPLGHGPRGVRGPRPRRQRRHEQVDHPLVLLPAQECAGHEIAHERQGDPQEVPVRLKHNAARVHQDASSPVVHNRSRRREGEQAVVDVAHHHRVGVQQVEPPEGVQPPHEKLLDQRGEAPAQLHVRDAVDQAPDVGVQPRDAVPHQHKPGPVRAIPHQGLQEPEQARRHALADQHDEGKARPDEEEAPPQTKEAGDVVVGGEKGYVRTPFPPSTWRQGALGGLGEGLKELVPPGVGRPAARPEAAALELATVGLAQGRGGLDVEACVHPVRHLGGSRRRAPRGGRLRPTP